MKTKHIFQMQPHFPPGIYLAVGFIIFVITLIINHSLNLKVAILFFVTCLLLAIVIWQSIYSQRLGFTLTSSHFQQHFYRGGWVLRWQNIKRIHSLEYNLNGFTVPIRWIGIEIKDYQAFIDKISPKVMTKLLLQQRSLLYLGLKQHGRLHELEKHIMNDTIYTYSNGRKVKGLQAIFANRMAIQKQVWGYEVFISENDLTIPKDELVGLARRYLAASWDEAE